MTSVMPANAQQELPEVLLTPAEFKELERKLSKAKSLLILDHPFFGASVSKRPLKFSNKIPTACMSAKGQITLNAEWCGDLTVKNLMFLLAHEALHFMLGHSVRRGHRKPKAWNIAADKVINDTLIKAGVGDFIDGGVTMVGASDLAAERLYDEADEDGEGPGGTGDDVGDPTDENGRPLDDSQVAEIEAQAKVEMIQCAKVAKMAGKLPAGVDRLVTQVLAVRTPWYDITERYMNAKMQEGKSFKRPDRRFVYRRIYLPGDDYLPKMGPVAIAFDTSGSAGQKEVDAFNGHVNRILEDCRPEKVYVIYCDAEVQGVDEFEPDDFPVKVKPKGGGGTRFEPVFDYIAANGIEPEVVIYLTDGWGDQDRFTSDLDTIWLTTDRTDFNWGTVVKFDLDED